MPDFIYSYFYIRNEFKYIILQAVLRCISENYVQNLDKWITSIAGRKSFFIAQCIKKNYSLQKADTLQVRQNKMTAPHAFLDILVNPQVRDAYLTGRISIILSENLETILWTNGAGARFTGFRTVAESINVDSGFDRVTMHQIEAGLTSMRTIRIRGIPQAQSFLASIIFIEQFGKAVFLHSSSAVESDSNIVNLTDGLNDETTEAAVLDLSGQIMCASPDFDPLLLATGELSALRQEAQKDGGVKKRFLAGNKKHPVGMLKLCDDPVIFLLIAAKMNEQKNIAHDKQQFVFDPKKLPQRFVWKINAEGKFTEVSPELGRIVGRKYADIAGCSFVDLVADWKMDKDGAVRALLKSHNAWSGHFLNWPIEGEKNRVLVEIAALPIYTQGRFFSGLRGFGIINDIVKSAPEEERTESGRLTPQEYKTFSAIASTLKANIFVDEEKTQTAPVHDQSLVKDNETAETNEQIVKTAKAGKEDNIQLQDRQDLLNQIPVAVLVYRETRILFVNQAFLEITGYTSTDITRQECLLSNIVDIWTPQNILCLASGEIISVDISTRPIIWEDDEQAYMISFVLTGRNMLKSEDKAEIKMLQYKVDQLTSLFNMVSDGIIIFDRAGIVASANEAAGHMFGFSPADMRGKLFSCFFSEDSQETVLLGFQNTRKGNRSFIPEEERELEGITSKGSILKLYVNFNQMEFGDGYVLIIRDMTRLHDIIADCVRDRHHTDEIFRKQSRYLSHVIHKIREPLDTVLRLSQIMAEKRSLPLSEDSYHNCLSNIQYSGKRIMALINDLNQLAKNESGKTEDDSKKACLPVIAHDILDRLMPQANNIGVIIRSFIPADLPLIFADTAAVRQILFNLLSNAVHYMPQEGKIIISAYHQENEILLRISDTGPGISQSEIQNIMTCSGKAAHKNILVKSDSDTIRLRLLKTRTLAEENHARFILYSQPGRGTIAEIFFTVTVGDQSSSASL